MKKIYTYLSVVTVMTTALFVFHSCDKPFDGVNAILTNVKIDHLVNVQIVDANTDATDPYPNSPVLTLSGEAVDKGLIYSTVGEPFDATPGSAVPTNNAISLAVRPNTVISKNQPLRFFIKAEAQNYISNSKEVIITSADSLQYVNVALLKLSNLPEGVKNETKQTTAVAGKIDTDFVVNIMEDNSNEAIVSATFPANTVFNDVSNNPITTSGNLNISVTNFSSTVPESFDALPGGITTVTNTNENISFIVAGAVDIKATLGNIAVKSFSSPIAFDVNIASDVYNPITKSPIKVGDQVPMWSKDENSTLWNNEGFATVTQDAVSGKLKTRILVSHLSTWITAFDLAACTNPTVLTYNSNSEETKTAYLKVYVKGGSNQMIIAKTLSVKNGSEIQFELPQGITSTAALYQGANDKGVLISTIDLAACAATATITNSLVSTNPTLSFDLQTSCSNGIFRYSGPIEYKEKGTALWSPFTPSDAGKLSTTLLAWDKNYDFRIIYRGQEYKRSRTVLQSEFRSNGAVWEFFGKTDVKQTFFNAPTNCE